MCAQAFHYDVSIMGARRAAEEGERESGPPRPTGPLKPIPPETCRCARTAPVLATCLIWHALNCLQWGLRV
jgi:hypothetical protein